MTRVDAFCSVSGYITGAPRSTRWPLTNAPTCPVSSRMILVRVVVTPSHRLTDFSFAAMSSAVYQQLGVSEGKIEVQWEFISSIL